jgi:hypothetical protein
MIWYGMVWYDMISYGMVWYDMIWYGMVWYDINIIYDMIYIKLQLGWHPVTVEQYTFRVEQSQNLKNVH